MYSWMLVYVIIYLYWINFVPGDCSLHFALVSDLTLSYNCTIICDCTLFWSNSTIHNSLDLQTINKLYPSLNLLYMYMNYTALCFFSPTAYMYMYTVLHLLVKIYRILSKWIMTIHWSDILDVVQWNTHSNLQEIQCIS